MGEIVSPWTPSWSGSIRVEMSGERTTSDAPPGMRRAGGWARRVPRAARAVRSARQQHGVNRAGPGGWPGGGAAWPRMTSNTKANLITYMAQPGQGSLGQDLIHSGRA